MKVGCKGVYIHGHVSLMFCVNSPVYVGPGRKPRGEGFFRRGYFIVVGAHEKHLSDIFYFIFLHFFYLFYAYCVGTQLTYS